MIAHRRTFETLLGLTVYGLLRVSAESRPNSAQIEEMQRVRLWSFASFLLPYMRWPDGSIPCPDKVGGMKTPRYRKIQEQQDQYTPNRTAITECSPKIFDSWTKTTIFQSQSHCVREEMRIKNDVASAAKPKTNKTHISVQHIALHLVFVYITMPKKHQASHSVQTSLWRTKQREQPHTTKTMIFGEDAYAGQDTEHHRQHVECRAKVVPKVAARVGEKNSPERPKRFRNMPSRKFEDRDFELAG